MDDEFKEFFTEFDEDLGLKALFAPPTTTLRPLTTTLRRWRRLGRPFSNGRRRRWSWWRRLEKPPPCPIWGRSQIASGWPQLSGMSCIFLSIFIKIFYWHDLDGLTWMKVQGFRTYFSRLDSANVYTKFLAFFTASWLPLSWQFSSSFGFGRWFAPWRGADDLERRKFLPPRLLQTISSTWRLLLRTFCDRLL